MHSLSEKITKNFLPFVMKPGRYVGNELGAITKDHRDKLKVALAFPDVYEIGMSYLGQAILYHLINRKQTSIAERVFSPWPDAEEIMRKEKIPLFSLETHTPLKEFDIIGFSLTYELNYTNVLNMLDLAGMPVFYSQRDKTYPLVIAGGPSTMNPEPMADFFDIFALGDGEEMVDEILGVIQQAKKENWTKEKLLLKLAQISGIYVPQFYEVNYDTTGQFSSIKPKLREIPERIKVRAVPELKSEFYPVAPIVPFLETTHDRLTIEIMRGCPMRCRFCAATVAYQPKRERPVSEIVKQAETGITNSGWDEISLLSLSTTDYSKLPELVKELNRKFSSKKVSVSLPSLRPDSLSLEVARLVSKVKKPGLTFAPEAGTVRLRNVAGKYLNEEDLLNTAKIAFSSGWNLLKLYFMIGLPTEREEDLTGIVDWLKKILRVAKDAGGGKNLNITISPFTPKPHTPFQWEKLEDVDSLQSKIYFLKSNLRQGNLHLKFRDPQVSYLEGILSRGDRRLSSVIYSAWKKGARLDGWSEHFDYSFWKEGFVEAGIEPSLYSGAKDMEVPLPWDHIDKGIKKDHLKKERNRAYTLSEESITPEDRKSTPFSGEETTSEKIRIADLVSAEEMEKAKTPSLEPFSDSSNSYGRKRKKIPVSLPVTVAKGRIRLRWSKSEEVRFTSHLDVGRTFERTIRRSGIPIAYSEGFHPHQKVAFGPPLPLGYISDSEYLDLQLTEPYTPLFLSQLNQSLPNGFKFLDARVILGKSESLSSVINLASYEVQLDIPPDQIDNGIQSLLERENLWIKRATKEQVKEVDIKRHIYKLDSESLGNLGTLKMYLGLGNEGYTRPDEILIYGLGMTEKEVLGLLIKRTGLFVVKDKQLFTPMEVV
jgi:radical SAM family uncharacterized protein/radical SAM-linked protein